MRTQIKSLALDLLIQHGYRGVSFGDLAAALSTTRANIHYHFGHKPTLVEEVLLDYLRETTQVMKEIWMVSDAPLVEKIERNVEFSRKRYLKYNPPGQEGRPWSLIARMRQDSSVLTPKAHEALQQFGRDLSACILAAVEDARRRKEFVAWMPVEDVALQLIGIANSAAPITQDAGSFDRLEQLYMGFTRIVTNAFGRQRLEQDRTAPRIGPATAKSHPHPRRPRG
jgi:TetR/AcrR family transcriptional repressor of nem operon